MRRFQFTLLGLFGLLTAAALGCAALMHPTALWCSAVAIAVATVLFAAVLGVVYRRGADRAFWVGFAVFGWGYLVLIYGPIVPIYSPDGINGGFQMASAVSSGPIAGLYELLHGRWPGFVGPFQHHRQPAGIDGLRPARRYSGEVVSCDKGTSDCGPACCRRAVKRTPHAPREEMAIGGGQEDGA